MKNIPRKIYLQIGPNVWVDDFNDLEGFEITWCRDKIFNNDIEYVRKKNLTNFEKVKAFHEKFKMYIGKKAFDLPNGEYILGLELIQEEYAELHQAIIDDDETEVLDALGDLLFVVYGMLVRLGVNADQLFDIIWRANMKKEGGKIRSDGKLLKPEGWTPPQEEIRNKFLNNK